MRAKILALTAASLLALAGCGDDDDDGDCDPLAETSHADSSVVWLQCPVGTCWTGTACDGEPQTFGWDAALSACPSGFRLPTLEEYEELLECQDGWSSCDPCGLSVPCANLFRPDGEYFCSSDVDRAYYSSSEVPQPDESDRVYTCRLDLGEIAMNEKSDLRPIRCVR